jgi:hypothetical protein
MRISIHIVIATLVSFGVSATSAVADDATSPVAGKLPDNTVPQQVYLFMLKKNGLSIRMDGPSFCRDLGYGEAAKGFWDQSKEIKDGNIVPGELNWVICQFPAKKP